jgi:hypothetical protein
MPEHIEAEIVEQLRRGVPRMRLAARFGYSDRKIRRIANTHGIPAIAGAPSLDRQLLPSTMAATEEERRERRRLSDRLYKERLRERERQQRNTRPAHWGQPRSETPVQDLAAGLASWRCHCGRVQSGTHCAGGHEAPWVPLTKPLEGMQ